MIDRKVWAMIPFAAVPLVIAGGCQPGPTTSPAADAKLAHQLPAHMPADFAAAAKRLRELHAELCAGKARPASEISALDESRDIARWLAQLAGDSDLDEAAWNQVNDASTTLQTLLGPPGTTLPRAYQELAEPIAQQVEHISRFAER